MNAAKDWTIRWLLFAVLWAFVAYAQEGPWALLTLAFPLWCASINARMWWHARIDRRRVTWTDVYPSEWRVVHGDSVRCHEGPYSAYKSGGRINATEEMEWVLDPDMDSFRFEIRDENDQVLGVGKV